MNQPSPDAYISPLLLIVQRSKNVSMKKAKKPEILPKPIRWYAPDEKAFKRLAGLGAPERAIYRGWKGEIPGKFKMRRGEVLGVVDGYSAFGNGKRAITKAVDAIHADGATVLDVETGRDSRTHGHILFDEATKPRGRSPEYRKMMAEGRADAYRKKHGQMAKANAFVIWRKAGMSVDEKAEVTGWSRASLYKAFKKTGAPAGRPPKHREE